MHPFSLTEEQINAVSGAGSYIEDEIARHLNGGYGTIGSPCILTWGIGETGGSYPVYDMM
ncbi:hypothetical protein [Massilia sp. AB1]|uniref:hypothetical protein n=1 Tax=Massilia sp. AB1 TaxID=2823371 RepID=UPI001B82783C|nr:hypothetical protein [Massilia sp. AB1]MBQ5940124.1 hypothetical protein [Massilia sp. AB1]